MAAADKNVPVGTVVRYEWEAPSDGNPGIEIVGRVLGHFDTDTPGRTGQLKVLVLSTNHPSPGFHFRPGVTFYTPPAWVDVVTEPSWPAELEAQPQD